MNTFAEFVNTDMATTNLDEFIAQGGLAERKIGALLGHNLGHNTLVISTPMHDFYDISDVASERNLVKKAAFSEEQVAQRPLDMKHAEKLGVYLLKGLANTLAKKLERSGQQIPSTLARIQHVLGMPPYMSMQPIVANIRDIGFGGSSGLRFEKGDGIVYVYLASKDVLWVVDGQHRRMAMNLLFDFLRQVIGNSRYPKRPALFPFEKGEEAVSSEMASTWMQIYEIARTTCTVTVEVHLGLSIEQERQLFHDLNNLGKKVEAGMAFKYDQANPINAWIKNVLIDQGILSAQVVDKDVTDWQSDNGVIARKDLIAVNSILFLNKTNVSSALPQDVDEKEDLGRRFWSIVDAVDGFGEAGAKQKTVAAQPVVLKAIAKLAYDFGFGRQRDPNLLERLMGGLEAGKIDFSHDNPMWRYYQLTEAERVKHNLEGLSVYLPGDDGNRDIGQYAAGVMRFGAKHNDIYPILGDMIRWKLGLPKRGE